MPPGAVGFQGERSPGGCRPKRRPRHRGRAGGAQARATRICSKNSPARRPVRRLTWRRRPPRARARRGSALAVQALASSITITTGAPGCSKRRALASTRPCPRRRPPPPPGAALGGGADLVLDALRQPEQGERVAVLTVVVDAAGVRRRGHEAVAAARRSRWLARRRGRRPRRPAGAAPGTRARGARCRGRSGAGTWPPAPSAGRCGGACGTVRLALRALGEVEVEVGRQAGRAGGAAEHDAQQVGARG